MWEAFVRADPESIPVLSSGNLFTSSDKYHTFVPIVDQCEVFHYVCFFTLKRKQFYFPDIVKYIFFHVKCLKATGIEAQ